MKHIYFLIIILLMPLGFSCTRTEKEKTVNVDSYAYEGSLTGKPFEFDTVIGIAGKMAFVGDNLFMTLYSKDNSAVMLDEDMNIAGLGFPIGQGPQEIVSAMGSFGQLLPAERIAIHDYNKNEIAVARGEDFSKGYDKIHLPKVVGKLSPRRMLQLNDGRYVMAKSMNYGLATIDANDSITDWPLGLDELDPEHPNVELTMQAPHFLEYARKRGIIGEAYGHIPAIILYNEDGSLNTVVKLGEIPDVGKLQIQDKRYINSLTLGDKYIYVLLGDKENPEMNLAVIDYDGNGVANLTIKSAGSIAVNEKTKRLVTTNSAIDEMFTYDLSSVPGLEL